MNTISKLKTPFAVTLKKYAYSFFLISAAVPFISLWLAEANLVTEPVAPYFAVVFFFGVIPILDWLLGKESLNVPEELSSEVSNQSFYKWLTLLTVPAMFAVMIVGLFQVSQASLNNWGKLGWILNIGIVSGVLAINVAHELVHKNSKFERFCGGLLLSLVCYGGFKVEHVRGHHVNVSTPEDPSSADYNQSIYHFLPRAYWHNITNAWKLESIRLNRKGLSRWSFKNELFTWYALSALWAALSFVFFGWIGLVLFLAQSFVAFTLLEIINYIEHYGLRRTKLDNGKYEYVTHHHSWNSNFFLTNILLIHLQRHSDHHAYPKRRYQVLRHHEDSPQLPAGYATMTLLALVPPLWKKVMNPIIDRYYS
ncbi:alkane 1-monooxygenase [Kangiella sediminilitoris]|uniref:Alkane 1-monooxygenase n=1 Tax=Kangiella sediminilitoris TaxID=1144748 RepID=A0A1B3BAV0_9GAMM|nr:alkane 1-monooxygenase [Kangiella sediminilitoris]AOE49930.1 Alkane 1-monooxygenase [Kangiella sediminilitoris]